jgi:hypothetical protein
MYQLKITIRDSKPPIWRRVLVPEQIPFSELHAVIQLAFGWNDEHLYMFEKGRKGDLGSEYRVWGEGESMDNAAITPLWAAIQNEGDKLVYTYDFGDWWDCLIVLEKQTHDTSIQPVSCLRGRGLPRRKIRGDCMVTMNCSYRPENLIILNRPRYAISLCWILNAGFTT